MVGALANGTAIIVIAIAETIENFAHWRRRMFGNLPLRTEGVEPNAAGVSTPQADAPLRIGDGASHAAPDTWVRAEVASSVITEKFTSCTAPKLVDIATSAASRPRAITMRPIRGWLWRASKVNQRPSR